MKNEGEQLIFGGVLREIREARELSVRGFSKVCGFSPIYISDLENNRRKVSLNVINTIAERVVLTKEENKVMMDAYSHDRLQIPVELLYYLIDNDLLDSLKTLKEKDEKGIGLKKLAKSLKSNKNM